MGSQYYKFLQRWNGQDLLTDQMWEANTKASDFAMGVVQLVECSPSIQEALHLICRQHGPGMVAYTCNPSLLECVKRISSISSPLLHKVF